MEVKNAMSSNVECFSRSCNKIRGFHLSHIESIAAVVKVSQLSQQPMFHSAKFTNRPSTDMPVFYLWWKERKAF